MDGNARILLQPPLAPRSAGVPPRQSRGLKEWRRCVRGGIARSLRMRTLRPDSADFPANGVCRRQPHTTTAAQAGVMRADVVPRGPLRFVALGRQQLGWKSSCVIIPATSRSTGQSVDARERGADALRMGGIVLGAARRIQSLFAPSAGGPKRQISGGIGGQSPDRVPRIKLAGEAVHVWLGNVMLDGDTANLR
jgi:hypothetical protein